MIYIKFIFISFSNTLISLFTYNDFVHPLFIHSHLNMAGIINPDKSFYFHYGGQLVSSTCCKRYY